jgi:hypothetical protein
VNSGSIEDAANILGDSPAIIRKHYAKWSRDYQSRTVELFRRIHGSGLDTPRTREEISETRLVNTAVSLVPGVGLEPTLSLRKKGF